MIPFANVEDAVEEVVLNIDACRPAAKDEVAVVLVELNDRAVTTPVNTPLPVTPSGVPGVDVPTPSVDVAMKFVAEALVVMKPPVNVIWVEVALFGKGYRKVMPEGSKFSTHRPF